MRQQSINYIILIFIVMDYLKRPKANASFSLLFSITVSFWGKNKFNLWPPNKLDRWKLSILHFWNWKEKYLSIYKGHIKLHDFKPHPILLIDKVLVGLSNTEQHFIFLIFSVIILYSYLITKIIILESHHWYLKTNILWMKAFCYGIMGTMSFHTS